MSYSQYILLLNELMQHGKTTGLNQSAEYLAYAKINLQRMARLEKTVEILPELKTQLRSINSGYTWLALTEGWCGDAAQNLPVIEAMAQQNPNIHLRVLLRDENPELMNLYLTNGAKSIPKLICLERDTMKEVFTWGPRPAVLQSLVMELKVKGVSLEEKGLIVQKWYNTDKTHSIQNEFAQLLRLMH